MGERGSGSQVSGGRIEKCREFVKLLSVCSCLCPCVVLRCVPPFIEGGEDAGYIRKREERGRKREKIEEKKPSGTAASFFSFMRVSPTL